MSRPNLTGRRPSSASGSDPEADERMPVCANLQSSSATDALWKYLRRIEYGLDQIDARIDRLYVALGGGTVLLAAIGLGSAFIVRGG